jgi:septal ring factor EnvC (AmiA/AmiB activator)
MEKDDLKVQVAALVADLFDEKEEAEIRKRTEAELEKAASAISNLTTALEEKNTEAAEMEEKLTASDTRVKELETELEAAKKELEEASTKLGEKEKILEDMKKDRAAEIRMAELEDAGVARTDRESQMNKVREMSDEDFASYKDELVSIREAVVSELEKAREEKAKADAKDAAEADDVAAKKEKMVEEEEEDDEKKKMKDSKKKEKCAESGEKEEAKEENKEDASEKVAPAQITPGQAAMASLNMEYLPNEDIKKKYAKLGEAMAMRFKNSKDE